MHPLAIALLALLQGTSPITKDLESQLFNQGLLRNTDSRTHQAAILDSFYAAAEDLALNPEQRWERKKRILDLMQFYAADAVVSGDEQALHSLRELLRSVVGRVAVTVYTDYDVSALATHGEKTDANAFLALEFLNAVRKPLLVNLQSADSSVRDRAQSVQKSLSGYTLRLAALWPNLYKHWEGLSVWFGGPNVMALWSGYPNRQEFEFAVVQTKTGALLRGDSGAYVQAYQGSEPSLKLTLQAVIDFIESEGPISDRMVALEMLRELTRRNSVKPAIRVLVEKALEAYEPAARARALCDLILSAQSSEDPRLLHPLPRKVLSLK